MSNYIQRSAITDAVFSALTLTGRQVGDGVAPRGTAGWIGQPNADGTNFIPYSVLTPLPASMGGGSVAEPNQDIWFMFAIVSYGVSRAQCEDQADAMRNAVQRMHKVDITQWAGTSDEYRRRIQSVVVQSYGGVQPVGDTDPRTYGQTDTVSLWTTG